MKNSILSLEGVEVLSKNQQKNVYGGKEQLMDDGKVGCCYLRIGRSPFCALSITEAKAMFSMAQSAGITDAGWCCASC